MKVSDLPPIVSTIQVERFIEELEAVSRHEAFVVSLQPPIRAQFHAGAIRAELLTLTRLAAQATYQFGERIVKIANLGDWGLLDHNEQAQAAAISATILHSLVRDDVASLDTLKEWAFEGPPDTEKCRQAMAQVERCLTFLGALDAGALGRNAQLDLWFEYSTTPFRFHDERLITAPELFMLGGHLVRISPPTIEWADQESKLLTTSRSPVAISVVPGKEDFAYKATSQMAKGSQRPCIVRFDPSDTEGSTRGSTSMMNLIGELRVVTDSPIIGCTVSDSTTRQHIEEMLGFLRSEGIRLGNLDVQLGNRSRETINLASEFIDQLSR